MNINIISSIENLLKRKILKTILMSNSFNINCLKIKTENKKYYIVKYYNNKKNNFNAIKTEAKNLIFFNKKKNKYISKSYKK